MASAVSKAAARDEDINVIDVVPGSIADGLLKLTTAARASGQWLRLFDIRYATAGIPCEITPHYVMFPPDSTEVLETGPLNEPATNFEQLKNPKMILIQAIIHAEICSPNTLKRK